MLAISAVVAATCHDTPHHADTVDCKRCTTTDQCDYGSVCWPDGRCRVSPPFHVHFRQPRLTNHDGMVWLVEGGDPVVVDVVADETEVGARQTVAAVTLCACASPQHSESHVEGGIVALDREKPEQTGCATPAAGLRVHRYALSNGTFDVLALVPPGNRYYAEVAVSYTVVAPSRYMSGWHEPGTVVTERFVQTLDGLDVRVGCALDMRYDMHAERCASKLATLHSWWFLLYVFGCALVTVLLMWVCRLRAHSIAVRQTTH